MTKPAHSPAAVIPDEIESVAPPRGWRWRVWLLVLLLLLSILTASVWFIQHRLITYACGNLTALVRLPLQCVNARGSLPGTLTVDVIRYSSPKFAVELKGVTLRPSLGWMLAGRAVFRSVTAKELSIFIFRPGKGPIKLPKSMALPLGIDIHDARVERLTYYGPNSKPLMFSSLRTRASLDRQSWTLTDASGDFVGVHMQGQASMNTSLPYALSGVIDLSSTLRKQRFTAQLDARGALDATVVLKAKGKLGEAPAQLTSSMTLTGKHILPLTRAKVDRWPLHVWIPGLPQLDARVEATAIPAEHGWAGHINVVNLEPGSLDQHRLPATKASSNWHWDTTQHSLDLTDLHLLLPDGGDLQGRLAWNGRLEIDGRGQAIDLKHFWSTLHPTRLSGPFAVKTTDYHGYQVDADLQQGKDRLQAQGRIDKKGGEATTFLWTRGRSRIGGAGKIGFLTKRSFAASLQMQGVDPAAFGKYPAGLINGKVKMHGTLLPHVDAYIDAAIGNSTLFNGPLEIEGKAHYRPGILVLNQTRVRLDGGEAWLDGSLGRSGDRMAIKASLQGRQRWMPELAGQASIDGQLLGPLRWPAFNGRIKGTDLHFRDWHLSRIDAAVESDADLVPALQRRSMPALQLQLLAEGLNHASFTMGSLRGEASLGSNELVHLSLNAKQLQQGQLEMDELSLRADGPLAAHQLAIELNHAKQKASISATGAFDLKALRWQGQLTRFISSGRLPLQLSTPAEMNIGPSLINIVDLKLLSNTSLLQIDKVHWQPKHWSSRGRFSHLPLRDMLALSGRQPPQLDVMLGGEWNLAFENSLTGLLRVIRESGDIQPVEELQSLGLDKGVFELRAEQNRINATLDINSKAIGRIEGNLRSNLSERDGKLGLAGSAPLAGDLALDIPSLSWLGQWFSTPGYGFGGTFKGKVNIGGTVAKPELSGKLFARNVSAKAAVYGLDWRRGELDASIEQDRIVVERLSIQGGDGRLDGKGLLSLRENDPDISVELTAKRLAVLGRPDQKLIISGSGRATLRDKRVAINAAVNVDKGLVTLKNSQDSVLDDDVILPEKRRGAKGEQKKIGIFLSATVDLGTDFQIKHKSFNAEAGGVLRLESNPLRPATLAGNVEIDKGNLYTYGQKLALEQGSTLNFNGPPDNPAFNLKAYRENLPISTKTGESPKVGVHVSGTARRPVVKLISNPEMSDREKLSWLIFRQDLNANKGNNQTTVISTAASALWSELGSDGATSLNETVGIDEFSFEQNATDVSKGVFKLGKQLIPNLYVSYGKGYNGAKDELQLNYLFNRKWSLEAKSGSTTAVDIFYTISID